MCTAKNLVLGGTSLQILSRTGETPPQKNHSYIKKKHVAFIIALKH